MAEFLLRNVIDDDHLFLVNLHNDELVLKNITNPTPITFESHMSWWRSIENSNTQIRKIFCVDGERAGFVKFYNIDYINGNVILGADLDESMRGKGYAKEMWQLMLEFCFQKLNLYRVSLTVAEYNLIGQKVYTKLGFKEEGRLHKSLYRDDKFYDQICMYLLCDEWQLQNNICIEGI